MNRDQGIASCKQSVFQLEEMVAIKSGNYLSTTNWWLELATNVTKILIERIHNLKLNAHGSKKVRHKNRTIFIKVINYRIRLFKTTNIKSLLKVRQKVAEKVEEEPISF